ncbi:unnamed protein product [Owenia fusiformis]|uniref:Neurexin n=1 Tax=Owenia fusiformis TaxID=6347 RepID=A0A8S4N3S6_OWEFU|nr:unnamed protein product [Owenia fusiformis]
MRDQLFALFYATTTLLYVVLGDVTKHDKLYTFNVEAGGGGYMRFTPDWVNNKPHHVKIKFRTWKPTAFLMNYMLMDNARKVPYYSMNVTLKGGQLEVVHQFRSYIETFTFGKGLNHDRWHDMDILQNMPLGAVTIVLDSVTKTQVLDAYSKGGAYEGLSNFKGTYSSLISFGGLESGVSHPFIGCMGGFYFKQENSKPLHPPISASRNIQDGCLSSCDIRPTCQAGTCINHYISKSCDCFRTNREGALCDKKQVTTVSMRGFEWISYKIYKEKSHSPTNRVSLEFKTIHKDGILFYGSGTDPHPSHIVMSLKDGVAVVSILFTHDLALDLMFKLGQNLNDNKWHSLTLIHHHHQVNVTLDGRNVTHVMDESEHFHVHLDPVVYIGGIKQSAISGVMTTPRTPFIGCLRNVYYNDISILEQVRLRNPSSDYFGTKIQYGCQVIDDVSITFPSTKSMLKLPIDSLSVLQMSLEFRTLKSDGIMLYTEIKSIARPQLGHVEVWLISGELNLFYQVDNKNHQQKARIGKRLNDDNWHQLQFLFSSGMVTLVVDGITKKVSLMQGPVKTQGDIYVGYGKDEYSAGFIGCMRNIFLQGVMLGPMYIVHTPNVVHGAMLNGCRLTDFCLNDTTCEHSGKCVTDWHGKKCDCTDTGYEGKTCQFALHQPTCHDYWEQGATISGIYPIDVDNNGPLDFTYVNCEMSPQGGVTVVEHNMPMGEIVRGPEMDDRRYNIRYRGMTTAMLKGLVEGSRQCQQTVYYSCNSAPLSFSDRHTWFVSVFGEVIQTLGHAEGDSEPCGCFTGVDGNLECATCSCDLDSIEAGSDNGTLLSERSVPITQMNFKQQGYGNATVTLGPLKCSGKKLEPKGSGAVTFTMGNSSLALPTWIDGALVFNFKTRQENGVILYQSPGPNKGSFLSITLKQRKNIEIQFQLQEVSDKVTLESHLPLNDGRWNRVIIEQDQYNARFAVNGYRQLVDLEELLKLKDERGDRRKRNTEETSGFTGPLYIGAPPGAVMGEGLMGSVKGLKYNNIYHNLAEMITPQTIGVLRGIHSACDTAPCMNQAQCIERWNSYLCLCRDPMSHFGKNCELNINSALLSLHSPGSFLIYKSPIEPDLISSDIQFGFRTSASDGLLIFIHDHLNNFLQMEVQNTNEFVLRFNVMFDIKEERLLIEKNLTDNRWKRVSLRLESDGRPRITVAGVTRLLNTYRNAMTFYMRNPFITEETVIPPRPADFPPTGITMYVGGAPESMTKLPSLLGCLRGLKIGQKFWHFTKADFQQGDLTFDESGCRDPGAIVPAPSIQLAPVQARNTIEYKHGQTGYQFLPWDVGPAEVQSLSASGAGTDQSSHMDSRDTVTLAVIVMSVIGVAMLLTGVIAFLLWKKNQYNKYKEKATKAERENLMYKSNGSTPTARKFSGPAKPPRGTRVPGTPLKIIASMEDLTPQELKVPLDEEALVGIPEYDEHDRSLTPDLPPPPDVYNVAPPPSDLEWDPQMDSTPLKLDYIYQQPNPHLMTLTPGLENDDIIAGSDRTLTSPYGNDTANITIPYEDSPEEPRETRKENQVPDTTPSPRNRPYMYEPINNLNKEDTPGPKDNHEINPILQHVPNEVYDKPEGSDIDGIYPKEDIDNEKESNIPVFSQSDKLVNTDQVPIEYPSNNVQYDNVNPMDNLPYDGWGKNPYDNVEDKFATLEDIHAESDEPESTDSDVSSVIDSYNVSYNGVFESKSATPQAKALDDIIASPTMEDTLDKPNNPMVYSPNGDSSTPSSEDNIPTHKQQFDDSPDSSGMDSGIDTMKPPRKKSVTFNETPVMIDVAHMQEYNEDGVQSPNNTPKEEFPSNENEDSDKSTTKGSTEGVHKNYTTNENDDNQMLITEPVQESTPTRQFKKKAKRPGGTKKKGGTPSRLPLTKK